MPARITDKDEIVKNAEIYLITNNQIDVLWFIRNDMNYPDVVDSFVNDVAAKMERTGRYKIAKDFMPDGLYVKPLPIPEKTWKEKHPILSDFRTAGIGAGFSLLVGIILWLIANHKQDLKDTQQDGRIEALSDSVKMLQKNMPKPIDTSKTHK